MNNTVLKLLQIFENLTDDEHMLTKNQIMQELVDEGYESIGDNQFYRKIDELKENGYQIEMKKGKSTYYYLKRSRLKREEWVYLLTLLLGNKDLSRKETNHIIEALENMSVCLASVDYMSDRKERMAADKSKFGQLSNFKVILKAMEEKKAVEYTLLSCENGENKYSERKTLFPVDFTAKDSRIYILSEKNEKILLADMLDLEML